MYSIIRFPNTARGRQVRNAFTRFILNALESMGIEFEQSNEGTRVITQDDRSYETHGLNFVINTERTPIHVGLFTDGVDEASHIEHVNFHEHDRVVGTRRVIEVLAAIAQLTEPANQKEGPVVAGYETVIHHDYIEVGCNRVELDELEALYRAVHDFNKS